MADSDNPVTPDQLQAQPQQAVTTQSGILPLSSADILKKTHADTAKTLSFWLLGILAGTVVLHYACVMTLVLLGKDYELPIIADVLHLWLPVLAGLAGSAATYYFTRDRS